MAIISFRGPRGSGKTTAAMVAVKDFGFDLLSFASPLKQEVYDLIIERMNRYAGSTNPGIDADPTTLASLEDAVEIARAEAWPAYPDSDQKIAIINSAKGVVTPVLQWYGTDFYRAHDPNHWVKVFLTQLKVLTTQGIHVAVDDARFDNEVAAITRNRGFDVEILVPGEMAHERLLKRDGPTPLYSAHASEKGVDMQPHAVITNDASLEAFRQNAAFMIRRALARS